MSITENAMRPAVSDMADTLIGSEIIKQANEINEKIRNGANIFNLTIGDFDPAVFPIPAIPITLWQTECLTSVKP
jgi:hypothetical protein